MRIREFCKKEPREAALILSLLGGRLQSACVQRRNLGSHNRSTSRESSGSNRCSRNDRCRPDRTRTGTPQGKRLRKTILSWSKISGFRLHSARMFWSARLDRTVFPLDDADTGGREFGGSPRWARTSYDCTRAQMLKSVVCAWSISYPHECKRSSHESDVKSLELDRF